MCTQSGNGATHPHISQPIWSQPSETCSRGLLVTPHVTIKCTASPRHVPNSMFSLHSTTELDLYNILYSWIHAGMVSYVVTGGGSNTRSMLWRRLLRVKRVELFQQSVCGWPVFNEVNSKQHKEDGGREDCQNIHPLQSNKIYTYMVVHKCTHPHYCMHTHTHTHTHARTHARTHSHTRKAVPALSCNQLSGDKEAFTRTWVLDKTQLSFLCPKVAS